MQGWVCNTMVEVGGLQGPGVRSVPCGKIVSSEAKTLEFLKVGSERRGLHMSLAVKGGVDVQP